MSDKPPFNFLENIRSGDDALLLSDSEWILLEFALDQFGRPLSRFLLSGLGEDTVVPGWLFTVTFSRDEGRSYSRNVRVEADDRPDVAPTAPRYKEPLIALALLWLLIVDRKLASFRLSYDQDEVLRLLGWEDTQESRLSIDEAVEQYFTLSYNWALDERELAEAGLSFFVSSSRFISEYGWETAEEGDEIKRTANHVQFNEEFVKELMRHSLFGIRWENVDSMERSAIKPKE